MLSLLSGNISAMADPEKLEVSSNGYHYRYDFEDGDVVLESSDKVKFRLHSVLLMQSSTVFRDMIELAQPGDEAVPISESSESLALLLDCLYPIHAPALPKPATLMDAMKLADIADKYDMPRVIASMRAVMHDEKYRQSPIDLYAFACKWQWPEIAAIASTDSLQYDLSHDQCVDKMQQLNVVDLCKLLKLHNRRKRQIAACLDKPRSHDVAGNPQITKCACIVDRMEADIDEFMNVLTLVEEAHARMKEVIPMPLHCRPLGDNLVSEALSRDVFREADDIKCPYCRGKMLPLVDITADIQQMVDKDAVRSTNDIKD